MKKIAVVGANGYLARNFTHLYKQNNQIDIYTYGYEDCHMDNYEKYQKIDVFNPDDMKYVVCNCDIIYFFTGKTGTLQGFKQHDEFLNLNIRSLINTLNVAKDYNPSVKIVFPSTRLVYEGSENALSEDDKKQFLTPYALQKFMCEEYLKMYSNLYGIRYSVARICVPYGSHISNISSYGTIGFFVDQIKKNGKIKLFGDGEQRRTFTYIDDLCEALYSIGVNSVCDNQLYNIGGENLSLKQLATMIVGKLGGSIEYVEWPVETKKIESGSTIFDSSKLDNSINLYKRTKINDWLKEI